jgi:hypothetical protein
MYIGKTHVVHETSLSALRVVREGCSMTENYNVPVRLHFATYSRTAEHTPNTAEHTPNTAVLCNILHRHNLSTT